MFGRISTRVASTSLRTFSTKQPAGTKLFSKSHEYIKYDSDGTVFIGISNYAQKALGDLVYVDLPSTDIDIPSGQAFASIESVKSANEAYTPVSGRIIQVNEALTSAVELINTDAEGEGWIIKVALSDPSETSTLMDEHAYGEYCKTL